jgi:hypothetical protein
MHTSSSWAEKTSIHKLSSISVVDEEVAVAVLSSVVVLDNSDVDVTLVVVLEAVMYWRWYSSSSVHSSLVGGRYSVNDFFSRGGRGGTGGAGR